MLLKFKALIVDKKTDYKKYHSHNTKSGRYVADFVFGANDGIVTTFAVIAGAMGAALSSRVIIILGLANLIAGAISMGLGNYLGQKSKSDYVQRKSKEEEWGIDNIPEEEKLEIREIYKDLGFEGDDLNKAVQITTKNKKGWLKLMMRMELDLGGGESTSPIMHGINTFIAFIILGTIPIAPFIFSDSLTFAFIISLIATVLILFIVGALRTKITRSNWLKSGIEMLLIGSLAAGAAYLLGDVIAGLII